MHNKMMKKLYGVSLLALSLTATYTARGETFVFAPVSASASTSYTDPAWGLPVSMINGSGLTGEGYTATHTNASEQNLFWHSDGTTVSGQWVEFDLGAAYDLKNALIWQLAQSGQTTRGVKVFTISAAGDDHLFSTISTTNLNIATGSANEPVQVRPLVASDARYVRFTIQSNYGDSYVGLSEVRFEGVLTPPLIAPVKATASSNYGSKPYLYGPQWLIDGSGMSGSGRRATHTNANATNLFWHSNTDIVVADQWLEFDLGATYHVTNALIWQMAQQENINRGVKAFTISVAGPDRNFSIYSTNNLLNQAIGLANEPVQKVTLVATNVQYVKYSIESNWGAGNIVGLSEVRFDGVPWELPAPRDLVWSGTNGDAVWNNVAQNWLTNGSATAFATGDHVLFDDTAAEKSVTFSNNVAAGAIVVDSTADYRISAGTVADNRIAAAASLIKRGSGVLELGGGSESDTGTYHSFTGDVQILEGTVKTISHGRGTVDPEEGLLGNPSVERKIIVTNGATLFFGGVNTLGTTESTPKVKLEVVDGGVFQSAPNLVNTLGPALFDNGVIALLTGYFNDWGSLVLNGDLEFKGSTPYTITSLEGAYLIIGFTRTPSIMVDDITADSAADLILNIAIHNTHGIPSSFNKTGAGTLRLNTDTSTFTGNVAVVAGTLETGEGTGITNQFHNVLGNCKVPRKLTVASGATLKISGSNTLVTGFDSALLAIEINGGTLQLGDNTSNVFGPLTLEDATVNYNTGYLITSEWGMMIFSGKVIFKGTQPYVFAPAGANCNFQSGLNQEIEMNVWDITGSSATDVALNLPFINFSGVTNKPPSRFYKTGPGTLSLGAVNTSTGALRVVEGVLRIDGSWSAVNSSVIAESDGYLGGTGSVARAVFDGGGFECTMGQSGLLKAVTVVAGTTGTVRILNSERLPINQLKVPFMTYSAIEGIENLANWTVEVAGVEATDDLRVKARNGILTAGWAPPGTLMLLR